MIIALVGLISTHQIDIVFPFSLIENCLHSDCTIVSVRVHKYLNFALKLTSVAVEKDCIFRDFFLVLRDQNSAPFPMEFS